MAALLKLSRAIDFVNNRFGDEIDSHMLV